MQNEKYKQLFDMLERKYGFEGFVHYTAYDNLKSIFDMGCLLSRNEMHEKNKDFIDVAWPSVLQGTKDIVKNATRFMYSFNTPISYRFEQNAQDEGTEMVAIVFDKKIVLDYFTYFYEKSPAIHEEVTPYMNLDYALKFNWNQIFERGPMNYNEKIEKIHYRNAEIAILNNVSTDYIKTIYFASQEYLNKAIKDFGENKLFKLGKRGTYKHFAEL